MDLATTIREIDGDTVLAAMNREGTLTVSINPKLKEIAKNYAKEVPNSGGITDYITMLLLADLHKAGKLENGLNNE